jgi:hypothetical protein
VGRAAAVHVAERELELVVPRRGEDRVVARRVVEDLRRAREAARVARRVGRAKDEVLRSERGGEPVVLVDVDGEALTGRLADDGQTLRPRSHRNSFVNITSAPTRHPSRHDGRLNSAVAVVVAGGVCRTGLPCLLDQTEQGTFRWADGRAHSRRASKRHRRPRREHIGCRRAAAPRRAVEHQPVGAPRKVVGGSARCRIAAHGPGSIAAPPGGERNRAPRGVRTGYRGGQARPANHAGGGVVPRQLPPHRRADPHCTAAPAERLQPRLAAPGKPRIRRLPARLRHRAGADFSRGRPG